MFKKLESKDVYLGGETLEMPNTNKGMIELCPADFKLRLIIFFKKIKNVDAPIRKVPRTKVASGKVTNSRLDFSNDKKVKLEIYYIDNSFLLWQIA